MSTVKGTIDAGVCGFVTEVKASCEDSQHVSFEIATQVCGSFFAVRFRASRNSAQESSQGSLFRCWNPGRLTM